MEGMQVLGYQPFRAPEGHLGQAMLVVTNRGNIFCLYHPPQKMDAAVIWVGGARGGVIGPAGGLYLALAQDLASQNIGSLRLDYRAPNDLYECVLDALAATALLEGVGFKRLAIVGHSFGGAVAVASGTSSPNVVAVAALCSQDTGCEQVAQLSPRPLFLAHGTNDERIPIQASENIFNEAKDPKEFHRLEGAGHGLMECKDQVRDLLGAWLVKHLGPDTSGPDPTPPPRLLRPNDPPPGPPPRR
ncbi:MAG: alpha/beta hydrolase [Dehalococcoidia bacterium]|nr:alpha/beta hydrolase [Dehalococcoidia bacterium]